METTVVSHWRRGHNIFLDDFIKYVKGAACKKMIIWNGNSGQKVLDVDTENQVSGIHWNERLREIITCHGYPNNVLRLWKYPKFSHMIDFDGHDGRILCSSQSPCGKYVCSLGEDETLRLWKAFFSVIEEVD